ncbi:hypothetical protein LINPERHAP1_LOCUS9303, partial [Linum perenne]
GSTILILGRNSGEVIEALPGLNSSWASVSRTFDLRRNLDLIAGGFPLYGGVWVEDDGSTELVLISSVRPILVLKDDQLLRPGFYVEVLPLI